MPYKFPEVSFDWLAKLPDVIDEAAGKQSRKEVLADLDMSNPDAMEKKAALLFRSGRGPDMEMGLRLQTAAREKRALSHRISEDQRYQRLLGPLLKSFESGGDATTGVPDVPAPAPQQPDIPWGSGGAIPGVSQAPPAPPVGPGVPGNMAASPSEELLARAEGGPVAPQPGPRFAQAGGAPSLPPQAAPPALPPWMQGAQAQPMTVPQASVGAPPLQQRNVQDVAVMEAKKLEQQLQATAALGPKAPQGLLQSLLVRYRNALEKTQLTPDQKNYEFEQTQRRLQGLERMPFADFLNRKETAGKNLEEVQNYYKEYRKESQSQGNVVRTIDRMEKIMEHPEFTSGRGTALYSTAVSAMQGLTGIAKVYGIAFPEDWQKRIDAIADPAKRATALAEEFTALSNKLVKDSLGTLGNQISEGDRGFVERMFSSLSLTPQGNRALLKFMRMTAEHAQNNEKWAREYRQTAKGTANAPDMEAYIARKQEENSLFVKNGQLTEAGKKAEAEAAKLAPQQPSAPAAQPPRPVGPGGQPLVTPGDIIYDNKGRPHRMQNGRPVPVEQEGL